ncbi:MAG: hypothetical protein PUH92_05655, partial [Bacilli bacterium]|nr:hypothetical protein [Bacilli bacterium]
SFYVPPCIDDKGNCRKWNRFSVKPIFVSVHGLKQKQSPIGVALHLKSNRNEKSIAAIAAMRFILLEINGNIL